MIGQLERIIELQNLKRLPGEKGKQNIIVFTSGKGGAGKTFVSLNLAYVVSKKGQKVLFVDLDLNYANAHILLNLAFKKNLAHYFMGKSLLKNLIFHVEENFHLLPGNSGSLILDNISNERINMFFAVLKKLSSGYDFIFIDTGKINTNALLKILLNSNLLVIVTTPEPTAVMDAYVIVKMLKKNKVPIPKLVIINKCSDEEEASTAFNNLNTAATYFLHENLHLLGFINFDLSVQKSIISQTLLSKKYISSIANKQINNLASSLSEIMQMANINHSNNSINIK